MCFTRYIYIYIYLLIYIYIDYNISSLPLSFICPCLFSQTQERAKITQIYTRHTHRIKQRVLDTSHIYTHPYICTHTSTSASSSATRSLSEERTLLRTLSRESSTARSYLLTHTHTSEN